MDLVSSFWHTGAWGGTVLCSVGIRNVGGKSEVEYPQSVL